MNGNELLNEIKKNISNNKYTMVFYKDNGVEIFGNKNRGKDDYFSDIECSYTNFISNIEIDLSCRTDYKRIEKKEDIIGLMVSDDLINWQFQHDQTMKYNEGMRITQDMVGIKLIN